MKLESAAVEKLSRRRKIPFRDAGTRPTSIRLEPALRAQLEKAAKRNFRSLSRELEIRLRRSFEPDDLEAVIDLEALIERTMRHVLAESQR